jgi:hypothetical protein
LLEEKQEKKPEAKVTVNSSDNVVRPVSLEGMNRADGSGSDDDVYISLVDGKIHNIRGAMLDDGGDDDDDDDEQVKGETEGKTKGGEKTNTSTSKSSATTIVSMPDLSSMLPKERHALALQPAKDAADYMVRMREYKGLERRLGKDAPAKAVEGLSGIAWDYHEDERPNRGNGVVGRRGGDGSSIEVLDAPRLKDGIAASVAGTSAIASSTSSREKDNKKKVSVVNSEDDSDEDELPSEMTNTKSMSLFGNLSSSSDEDDDE